MTTNKILLLLLLLHRIVDCLKQFYLTHLSEGAAFHLHIPYVGQIIMSLCNKTVI